MFYDRKFFVKRRAVTLASAECILDLLWRVYQPRSVLDVGCATGIWLAESRRRGASRILGVDGPWVPHDELEIPEDRFIECDLGCGLPENVSKYDLAFCIEVAEHLSAEGGDRLVDFLTDTADVVVFSAAVPGQGGTGHVNEQRQSYWFERFVSRKFSCFDVIRPLVWSDDRVNVIYKQNMLVYVRCGSEAEGSLLGSGISGNVTTAFELERIHPELLALRTSRERIGLGGRVKRKIKRILHRT